MITAELAQSLMDLMMLVGLLSGFAIGWLTHSFLGKLGNKL
jgi:hypothetical protein